MHDRMVSKNPFVSICCRFTSVALSFALDVIEGFICELCIFLLRLFLTDAEDLPCSFTGSLLFSAGVKSLWSVDWSGCAFVKGIFAFFGSGSCNSLIVNWFYYFGWLSKSSLSLSVTLERLPFFSLALKRWFAWLLKCWRLLQRFVHNHSNLCSIDLNVICQAIKALKIKKEYRFAAVIPITTVQCYRGSEYLVSYSWFGRKRPCTKHDVDQMIKDELRAAEMQHEGIRVPMQRVVLMTFPLLVRTCLMESRIKRRTMEQHELIHQQEKF